MPNQNNPNQNNQSVTTNQPPTVSLPMDLPPLPTETHEANIPATPPTPTSQGSTSPSENSTVISTSPKKKFGGGRIIATILGILVLVGGIGAGYILTQRPQLLQSQAKTCEDFGSPKKRKACRQAAADQAAALIQATNNQANNNTSYNPNVTLPWIEGGYTKSQVVNTSAGTNQAGWDCGGPCPQEWDTDVAGYYIAPNNNYYPIGLNFQTGETDTKDTGGPIATPTPTPNPTAPKCLNVKAYNSAWTLLSNSDLSSLATGSAINFCVAGSNGTFDKATFKINSTTEPETTTKGQGAAASDFCQSYTILSTDTTVSVKAKVHDSVSNTWVGETF